MPIINTELGKNVTITNESLVNIYECSIGDNTKIGPFVEIQKNVTIGKNCKVSSHTFICEGVEIESNVFITHGIVFINDRFSNTTNKNGSMKGENDWIIENTRVEEGASIGSGTIILCGLTIGSNSRIGAGSVVTRNVKSNSTVFGNPSK